MEIIPKPNQQQLNNLKEGLINKVKSYGLNNAVYSLREGNTNYTLLYCKEGLKLFGRHYNYTKCFFTLNYNKLKQELKEVLKKWKI